MPTVSVADNIPSAPQVSSGYQSSWVGAPGQVSMADIVKMGKPKAPALPNTSHSVNHHHAQGPSSAASQYNVRSSEDYNPKVSEDSLGPGVYSGQHPSVDDEWPSIEQPSGSSLPSLSKDHVDPELHQDPSSLQFDTMNRHPGTDDIQPDEDDTIEDHGSDHAVSASVSGRKMQEDDSGGAGVFDNDSYRNRGTYQPHSHAVEHLEGAYWFNIFALEDIFRFFFNNYILHVKKYQAEFFFFFQRWSFLENLHLYDI